MTPIPAGLEHIVFHTLRHHFASSPILKGVKLTTVWDRMGHKDIRTTNIYLSITDTMKREALEGCPSIFSNRSERLGYEMSSFMTKDLILKRSKQTFVNLSQPVTE